MRVAAKVGRSPAVIAAGSAVLLALAGCGEAYQSAGRAALAAARPAVRYDGHGAGALARRLLADLTLPQGARRWPWRLRPRMLGPGLGAPLTDVIDLRALYRLSQPVMPAEGFLIGHVRGGLVVGDHTIRAGTLGAAQADFDPAALPRGIYLQALTIGLVPAKGGGSVLRVDAFVAWYPRRTAAEHIDASRYRAVTVTAPARGGSTITRTFTRHSAVAKLAATVNSLPAMPDVVRFCPLMSAATSYSLVFTPAASRWPRIVAATQGCSVYTMTVGGRSQPPLYEGGSKLTAAIRKLVGLTPLT